VIVLQKLLKLGIGELMQLMVETWYWRVDATNDAGTTTGDVWTFEPFWSVEITDQSESQSVASGVEVELFVTAEGSTPFTYQWYKNDVLLDGETNSTLTIFPTSDATYKCVVSN